MNNRLDKLFQPNGNGNHLPQLWEEPIPQTALEERQQTLAHHVRMVARGMTNGLCVYGRRGGLGKTRIVLRTLREELVSPLLLNGHITPLSLYQNLFFNSNRIIFLDDADSLYRNLPALGILRSALWGEAGKGRVVTYNSSQIEIPSSFEFNGQIIFTANSLPQKNSAFDAVLSRIDVFELDASNEEVVEMMKCLAVEGFGNDLSATECLEVVNFIAEQAATRELSLRLLEPSYSKVIYAREAGIDWRDLVRSQLEQIGKEKTTETKMSRAEAEECLRQVMKEFPSVALQQETWSRLTGKSRPTFFRMKKALLEKGDK